MPPPGRQPGPVVTWTSADGQTITLTDPDMGFFIRPGHRGFGMAPYELHTQTSAAVDGDRITGVRAAAREIMLPLHVYADGRPAAVARFHALVRSMRPKRGDGTLTVAAANGQRRSIAARYVEGMEGRETHGEAGPDWWNFGIVLHASQPYWRADQTHLQFQTAGPEQTFFPFGPDWPVTDSQVIGLDMTIPNPGDVEAYPLWRLHGPLASGAVFRNNEIGREWALGRDLAMGDVAVVDCRQRAQTAVLNGTINLWPDLSDGAVLWPLAPGDNTVDMVVGGTTGETLIELDYTPRYEIAYADA